MHKLKAVASTGGSRVLCAPPPQTLFPAGDFPDDHDHHAAGSRGCSLYSGDCKGVN